MNAAQQLLSMFLDPWALRYKPRVQRMPRKGPLFDGTRIRASINRWTGKPHEHKREIARRLRQAGIL